MQVSGMRVFKASLLPEFQDLPDGLSFTPGMSTKILHIGMNYQEIPIEYQERTGESKLNALKDGYRFFLVIANVVRNHKPIAFFGTIGIPFFTACTFLVKKNGNSRWNQSFDLNFTLLFIVSALSWYLYTAGGSNLYNILNIGEHIANNVFVENPEFSGALRVS
ncbi:MAG: hypothetical protein QMD80_07250 [archaeon]|nr:hypothetical protein [archaeon]